MMGTIAPRILIIDDDEDFKVSISEVLRLQGYDVRVAASAHEGLDRITADPPDLIILDVIMEYDSAGYEVNQAVKFREEFSPERSIPILMVSSIPIDPATLYGRASEVQMITPDAYMTKPLDIPAFLDRVRTLLVSR
jgi:CheY-like chemotaxis protein